MRKFLKSTMAIALATTLLTSNTGYAQSVQRRVLDWKEKSQ